MGYPEREMDQNPPELEIDKPNPHREFIVKRNLDLLRKMSSGELTEQQVAKMWADRELELENRADHDGLTGLLNYQGFTDALTEDLSIIHQYDLPAYFGLLDGDKLKHINDTMGKLAGNKVIQAYAEALIKIIAKRPHLPSLIGRWGGDEFAILVIGGSGDEFIEMLGEVMQEVPETIKRALNIPDLNSTVSIGGIKVRNNDNALTLIEKADANLNKAKKDRNKLVFGEAPSTSKHR